MESLRALHPEPVAPPADIGPAPGPPTERPSATRGTLGPRFSAFLARLPPFVFATALYAISAAITFRAGVGGPGTFPQGTNALNTYLYYWFVQQHPLATWLFPFTDWGQPVPGFTGVTPLTPLALALDPGVLVRGIEIASWVGAGLSLYAGVRRIGGTPKGAAVAGLYYLMLAQTPQLFEGHVGVMVVVALAPLFLASVYRGLDRPNLTDGLLAALLLYLQVTLGDVGMVYFVLLFGVLLAAYTIARRILRDRYRRRELARVVIAVGVFALSMTSWLVPFALGIRPQYTTTITTSSLPFAQTASENFGYAFIGYVQDNSFVHFTYHRFSYGLFDQALLPLYFLIPVTLLVYVLAARNWDRGVLYLAAVLAMVFATGHLFPGLASFNGWIYDHVPYFGAIPALFRWNQITILAYGFLLGLLLSDLERGTWPVRGRLRSVLRRALRRPARAPSPPRPAWGRVRSFGHDVRARSRRRSVLMAIAMAVVAITVVQSFEVVAQPPGLFTYPSEYTAGFAALRHEPLHGGILAVPFSGIYERSPWGGVTESSLFMGPYFTGADTELFEAGTPYSLALDTFVGDGLTLGYSRNMTKLLGGLNVEYVVATRYANWSYINTFAYDPRLSYYALGNQTDLGPPEEVAGVQTLYQVPGSVGNVSFHPRYFVYYGPPALIYQVLDQPWYTGSGDVLIDGSSIAGDPAPFAAHAAGLIAAPASLGAIPAPALDAAFAAGVPVQIVGEANDATGFNVTHQLDPWNASGGQVVTVDEPTGSLVSDLSTAPLYDAGYRTVAVSVRASPPPGPAWLEATYGAGSVRVPLAGAHVSASQSLPYAQNGFAVPVAANNSTYAPGANATAYRSNGVDYLRWSFVNDSNDSQFLRMNVTNLTGWNGLALNLEGNAQIPLVWRILENSTVVDVPGYATFVPIQGNLTHASFYLPPSGYASGAGPMTPPGAVRGIELMLPPHVNVSSLVLSNVSLFDAPPAPYRSTYLGTFRLGGEDNLTVTAPTGARLNSVTISTGLVNASAPSTFVGGFAPLATPTALDFTPGVSGWGVVLLAQTYHPAWTLEGAGPAAHAAANIGLNAWLVDLAPADQLRITYGADALVVQAYELEGGLAGAALVGVAGVLVRRSRRPRSDP